MKLGNSLLVLLQAPFQLLSHMLFDRQVSPDRYAKKVIVNLSFHFLFTHDLKEVIILPFPILSPE